VTYPKDLLAWYFGHLARWW